MRIKALFLTANPSSTNRLQLDEEIRAISEKIRSAEYRDVIELVSAWAVRPDDLLQLLNQHKPQIVHFSGHGSSAGEILLVNEMGSPKPVSANAVKALFRTLKDNIRLVVLNACYSRTQAQAIVDTIECAVGMNTAIGDQAAIIFAASFYRALGFGRSAQEAFEQGKTALLLEGIPEESTPELLCRVGVDPALVHILEAEPDTSNTGAIKQLLFTDEMARKINMIEGKLQGLREKLVRGDDLSVTDMLTFQDLTKQQDQLLQFAPPEFLARFYSER